MYLYYNYNNIDSFGVSKINFMRNMMKELKITYSSLISGIGL